MDGFDPIAGLLYGLGVALTPTNILAALIGAFAGTLLGVLPGIGPVAGAAILLPLTFSLSPTAGVIMIAGIYYGVAYGGSTTAILLNIPGEVSSVPTAIDGYELTKQGRAGPALGITAMASFIAAVLSVFLVAFLGPLLARTALSFGPAEFFGLTMGGLLVLATAFSDRPINGLLPLLIGLMLGTVGAEAITGQHRFTFGNLDLADGISVVSLGVGLFGLTELIFLVKDGSPKLTRAGRIRFRDTLPTRSDVRAAAPAWARGGALGFVLGLLPGPSQALSTFLAYRVEQTFAKNRKNLGKGAIEGIAGPEAANNAAATSSILPLLALGLPFSATLALMIAALQVQGVTPGPLIIQQHPEIFWGVIASMLIGNVMLLVINLNLISLWVKLLSVRKDIIVPVILVGSFAGAFAGRYLSFDVYILIFVAALGFVLRYLGFSLAPVLLGVVLGPLVDKYLREALVLSNGDVSYLVVASPVSTGIWAVVVGVVIWAFVSRLVKRKRRLADALVGADLD